MPEFRIKRGIDACATRRNAHLTPCCLSGVRAKIGLPKTFRQPPTANMERTYRPSVLSFVGAGRGCNAAKFCRGNPAAAARDPVGRAHSRAVCLRRPAAARLPAVHSHVRIATRRARAAVRRRGRSLGAYDAPCEGLVGGAHRCAWRSPGRRLEAAVAACKPMIGHAYYAKSAVTHNGGTFCGGLRFGTVDGASQ